MCGIIGIFGKSSSKELVKQGLSIMAYRGRDNVSVCSKENYSIGHCLHSIVGFVKQPFKGKGIFTSNCEIYNWKELDSRFELKSRNDSELIFNLLEKSGWICILMGQEDT